jgi:hypothetical protein
LCLPHVDTNITNFCYFTSFNLGLKQGSYTFESSTIILSRWRRWSYCTSANVKPQWLQLSSQWFVFSPHFDAFSLWVLILVPVWDVFASDMLFGLTSFLTGVSSLFFELSVDFACLIILYFFTPSLQTHIYVYTLLFLLIKVSICHSYCIALYSLCAVSFVVCVVLRAVFCLSVVCYFIIVPLHWVKRRFQLKLIIIIIIIKEDCNYNVFQVKTGAMKSDCGTVWWDTLLFLIKPA